MRHERHFSLGNVSHVGLVQRYQESLRVNDARREAINFCWLKTCFTESVVLRQ